MYNSLKRLSETMQSSKALPKMAPSFLYNNISLCCVSAKTIENTTIRCCQPVQGRDFVIEAFIILEEAFVSRVQAVVCSQAEDPVQILQSKSHLWNWSYKYKSCVYTSQAKDAGQILQSDRKIIITSLGIENHKQTDATNKNHTFALRSYTWNICQLSLSQLWIRRTHPKLLRHWAIFIFVSVFKYLYLLTLNSSYTLLMLLVSAFPRMPPISTFSNFKNWGGDIFSFLLGMWNDLKAILPSTAVQYDSFNITWTAVLKNSTIVLSRFRNESKRWKTIFSWVVGENVEKTAKRRICIWTC